MSLFTINQDLSYSKAAGNWGTKKDITPSQAEGVFNALPVFETQADFEAAVAAGLISKDAWHFVKEES